VTSVPATTEVTGLPDEVTSRLVELVAGDAALPTEMSNGALAEREPEVPVIVAVEVPTEALLAAVRVKVVEPGSIGLAEKLAVRPLGSPAIDKLMLPPNPFSGSAISVDLPVPLGTRLTVLGAAESVNPGVLMVRFTPVLAVSAPEVPVMVIVGLPGTAELLADRVNVLLPVVGFGENDAVTPLGNPEAARLTLPANPN